MVDSGGWFKKRFGKLRFNKGKNEHLLVDLNRSYCKWITQNVKNLPEDTKKIFEEFSKEMSLSECYKVMNFKRQANHKLLGIV